MLEKCTCQRTNIVARSAAICSSMLNISLNTRAPIRVARSAEARRLSTHRRHLLPRRQKRVEVSPRINSLMERTTNCRCGFVASGREGRSRGWQTGLVVIRNSSIYFLPDEGPLPGFKQGLRRDWLCAAGRNPEWRFPRTSGSRCVGFRGS